MKKILLLVDKISRKKEALALGMQEYLKDKARVYLAKFSDITIEVNGRDIKIKTEGKNITDYSLVYFRRAGINYFTLAGTLGVCLKYLHIPFFDSAFAQIGPSGNKLTSQVYLAIAGLPTIPLFFCWPDKVLENVEYIVSKYGLPLIAKKTTSQRGLGVFMVNDKNDFERILATDPEGQFFFQKYCPAQKEYRLLVLGEKVKVWEAKIPTDPKEFRSNISLGGREEFYPLKDLPSKMEEIAVKAAKTLGIQVAGVDLLEEKKTGKIWLLEVNRGPGLTYDNEASSEIKELASFFLEESRKND